MQPCDLRYMAKCCRNLQHFGAEGVAVKSYIAMMPLFTRQDAIYTPLPWTVGGQSEARTYALQQVLDELLDVVRHEREVFSRVFQKWEVRETNLFLFSVFPPFSPFSENMFTD